jgi:acyl carrier protein
MDHFMEKKLDELMADLFEMSEEDISDSLTMKNTDVWDSLKHMELVIAIERTFGIELTFDEIVSMQNIGTIKRILKERGVSA